MTITESTPLDLLNALALPIEDGRVMWEELSHDERLTIARYLIGVTANEEPAVPTDGLLERALGVEDLSRSLAPLQHRYAGLLQDAYDSPKLRSTIGLPEGKTPFRDAADMLAKTHQLRGYESANRMKIARSLTPARPHDQSRDDEVPVGETRYPLLGEIQAEGTVHPSKLATAVNLLNTVDTHAQDAGKDEAFRDDMRKVIERDLVEHIRHTTPEEFSRYASRRKADIIASLDPVDQQFTDAQTQRMHNLWSEGPVRGNRNAYKWSMIVDAEGNEALKQIESYANNPRAGKNGKSKDSSDSESEADVHDEAADEHDDAADEAVADTRTRGQRSMHALRDALKFAIGNVEKSGLPGSRGNHTKMVVLADYPTLMEHLKGELAGIMPESTERQRERFIEFLAEQDIGEELPDVQEEVSGESGVSPPVMDAHGAGKACDDAKAQKGPRAGPPPGPKTTDLEEIRNDPNLDRLQARISQGIYTPNYPADTLLRLLCDVGVTPVTLTGKREVLSIGQESRAFPEYMRRAIIARDRGCTVPGCHWPAAWCEVHHIIQWAHDGETSTHNGLMLCGHHHQALHAKMLSIERRDGEVTFVQHPLIDPSQTPRKNRFWQN